MTVAILYDNHTNEWSDLAPRMVEFTKFKLHPIVPTITTDIHQALLHCSSDETWAVVITAGNVVFKPGIVDDIVEFCKRENSPLAGHILYQNGYYNLHPQFFCINLELYKEWGFGLEPGTENSIVTVPVARSQDNVHDDYTPWWIKADGETVTTVNCPDGFASRYISWLLQKGHRIVNIPQDIRENKLYSYVDYNHEDIRCFLKDVTYTCKESGANKFLSYARGGIEGLDAGFYPVNTEPFTKLIQPTFAFQAFAGVCGGIKPAIITAQSCCASDTKVTLFDISTIAIEWQQWLRQHWDGRRDSFRIVFEKFKNQYPSAKPLYFKHLDIVENLDWVLNNTCSEEEFINHWNHWLTLDVEYKKLNLLEEADQHILIDMLSERNLSTYIWTSNLFRMDWHVLMLEPGCAKESHNRFVKLLKNSDLSVVFEDQNVFNLLLYKPIVELLKKSNLSVVITDQNIFNLLLNGDCIKLSTTILSQN